MDKSIDITSEAQLLVYGKFACGCRIVEELRRSLALHSIYYRILLTRRVK